MKPKTRSFRYEGFKLVYDEYGERRQRTVILSPGLLFSRKMHGPLAQTLAKRGYRVVCIDLLGPRRLRPARRDVELLDADLRHAGARR